jgi:Protein of unknown function (DUF992)
MSMIKLAQKAKIAVIVGVALAMAGSMATPSLAQDTKRVKVGVLTCAAGASIGLLITSKEKISCAFQPDENETENYHGHIRKFGLDLGVTAASVIVWAVFAAQSGYKPGSLAGTYVGLSAEESVVLGLGANVLLGGSDKSIALQPLSVQAQAGLNIAVGVAELELTAR